MAKDTYEMSSSDEIELPDLVDLQAVEAYNLSKQGIMERALYGALMGSVAATLFLSEDDARPITTRFEELCDQTTYEGAFAVIKDINRRTDNLRRDLDTAPEFKEAMSNFPITECANMTTYWLRIVGPDGFVVMSTFFTREMLVKFDEKAVHFTKTKAVKVAFGTSDAGNAGKTKLMKHVRVQEVMKNLEVEQMGKKINSELTIRLTKIGIERFSWVRTFAAKLSKDFQAAADITAKQIEESHGARKYRFFSISPFFALAFSILGIAESAEPALANPAVMSAAFNNAPHSMVLDEISYNQTLDFSYNPEFPVPSMVLWDASTGVMTGQHKGELRENFSSARSGAFRYGNATIPVARADAIVSKMVDRRIEVGTSLGEYSRDFDPVEFQFIQSSAEAASEQLEGTRPLIISFFEDDILKGWDAYSSGELEAVITDIANAAAKASFAKSYEYSEGNGLQMFMASAEAASEQLEGTKPILWPISGKKARNR